MEKFDNFEDMKNSDTTSSKSGKVKNEESIIKFIELLKTNVITTKENMNKTKNIKTKR